jgi:Tfp pilus assembly protein PilX
MCTFEISRQPRGAALVIVMLVTAVLLLAGMSFLTISSTETQIALNERASAQAQLLAEAGIHKALARLRLNAESAFKETNTPLGGGTFSIDVTTVAGCTSSSARQVIATASVPVTGGTAKAEIRTAVDTVSYPYRWAAYAVVPNGIVVGNDYLGENRIDKELWVLNTSLLDSFDSGGGTYDSTANSGGRGNIGANGDVAVDYNSDVKGDITAGDDIFEGVGVTVTGGKTSNASSESFPQVTPGKTGPPLTVGKNQTMNLSSATYYYQYLDFKDGASLTVSGPVTIYVTGPGPAADALAVVRLGSNVTLGSEPGTQFRLITKSDGTDAEFVRFLAGSGFRFYGSLYGTNTDVYIGDSSQIFGSLIGRTVKMGAGTNIHFDQAMSTQEVCNKDPKKFSIRRGTWREIIPN